MRADIVLKTFEQLPLATLGDIIGAGGGAPLILAPHADDESLGCGGLIAECCQHGRPPIVVVVTDGCGSHPGSRAYPPARLRAVRAREVAAALACLGASAESLTFLGLPDTAAPESGPAFDAAVATINQLLRSNGCECILAPWQHDPHCDHVATAAMARRSSIETGVRHLAYPVWGWTLPPQTRLPDRDVSGFRLDISLHLAAKRAAIAAHASQYSDMITDDPDGFRLAPDFLEIFDRPYEVFVNP